MSEEKLDEFKRNLFRIVNIDFTTENGKVVEVLTKRGEAIRAGNIE